MHMQPGSGFELIDLRRVIPRKFAHSRSSSVTCVTFNIHLYGEPCAEMKMVPAAARILMLGHCEV